MTKFSFFLNQFAMSVPGLVRMMSGSDKVCLTGYNSVNISEKIIGKLSFWKVRLCLSVANHFKAHFSPYKKGIK
jgi:hypothetical protein